jgi:hypothetical protein
MSEQKKEEIGTREGEPTRGGGIGYQLVEQPPYDGVEGLETPSPPFNHGVKNYFSNEVWQFGYMSD